MGEMCVGVLAVSLMVLLPSLCACQQNQNRNEDHEMFEIASHKDHSIPQVFQLRKGDLHVNLSNLGATILSLSFPNAKGHIEDVVLGFDTLAQYQNSTGLYFGAVVGRVANRIKDAEFELDGKTYHLPANDGHNTLHGGKRGFDKALWRVRRKNLRGRNPSIEFTYHSRDGEQGFPGDLDVFARYTVGHMELRLDMKAIPRNKPTPVSLAQHTYWNLAGQGRGHNILGNWVKIWGSHYTPVDKTLIPTGQILGVKGTPFDFTNGSAVGSRIDALPGGYDINYSLDIPGKIKHGELRRAAIAEDKWSGRSVEVWTSAPGLQFYTANFLNGTVGKGGAVYKAHSGLCLESQAFPDAVNQHNFPSIIVHPGQVYRHTMVYQFSVNP